MLYSGKQYKIFPQETKTAIWFSNSTSEYIPKILSQNFRDISIPLFTAALFTITKRGKQPKCSLRDEWIKEMCYIHITFFSLTKKEILP